MPNGACETNMLLSVMLYNTTLKPTVSKYVRTDSGSKNLILADYKLFIYPTLMTIFFDLCAVHTAQQIVSNTIVSLVVVRPSML